MITGISIGAGSVAWVAAWALERANEGRWRCEMRLAEDVHMWVGENKVTGGHAALFPDFDQISVILPLASRCSCLTKAR